MTNMTNNDTAAIMNEEDFVDETLNINDKDDGDDEDKNEKVDVAVEEEDEDNANTPVEETVAHNEEQPNMEHSPSVQKVEDDDNDGDDEASKKEDPDKHMANEGPGGGGDDEAAEKKDAPIQLTKIEHMEEDDDDEGGDDWDPNEKNKKISSNNKKRKPSSSSEGGRKKKGKAVDGSSSAEPKAKKLRVKPEKVKEVSEKIINELTKSYGWGTKEMPMDTLASNAGYRNPRSDAILEAMKLLVKEGVVTKNKTGCMFTESGIEKYAPKEEEIEARNPTEALDQMWNQLENKLKSNDKTKGSKPLTAAKNIWELLQDGNPHPIKEVLGVTHYNMERSTGFPEIVKALTVLKFATKENKELKLTEKVLKFTHPTTETT